jgi:hypothetical protein
VSLDPLLAEILTKVGGFDVCIAALPTVFDFFYTTLCCKATCKSQMSLSRSIKRRNTSLEAEEAPSKRRIRSCDTCRRLKTRCESQIGSTVCHRCELLKQVSLHRMNSSGVILTLVLYRLECSLDAAESSLGRPAEPPRPQERAEETSRTCNSCDQRYYLSNNRSCERS